MNDPETTLVDAKQLPDFLSPSDDLSPPYPSWGLRMEAVKERRWDVVRQYLQLRRLPGWTRMQVTVKGEGVPDRDLGTHPVSLDSFEAIAEGEKHTPDDHILVVTSADHAR